MRLHLPLEAAGKGIYSRPPSPPDRNPALCKTALMAENKTQATGASVQEFLAAVEHPVRRADGFRMLALMSEITGEPAQMWGPTFVGFGHYHYGLTYGPEAAELLGRLGRHKLGAGCLYVNKLDDVDEAVLTELVRLGYRHVTTALHHD